MRQPIRPAAYNGVEIEHLDPGLADDHYQLDRHRHFRQRLLSRLHCAERRQHALHPRRSFTIDDSGYMVNATGVSARLAHRCRRQRRGRHRLGRLGADRYQHRTDQRHRDHRDDGPANLPADAAVNDTFTSSMPLYDSLGTANSMQITWKKTADNTWTASVANPTLTSNSTKTTAAAPTSTVSVSFNSDGSLASTDPLQNLLQNLD